jgi:hypothetical protein
VARNWASERAPGDPAGPTGPSALGVPASAGLATGAESRPTRARVATTRAECITAGYESGAKMPSWSVPGVSVERHVETVSTGRRPVTRHKTFDVVAPVRDMDRRADIEVETLLKIVLVLVVVWIGLEIVESVVDFVFGPFKSVFGLIIIVVIVLWLLDRI